MLENCSQEAFIGKVRISVSLSIKLLEAGGESLQKNKAVDKAIKLKSEIPIGKLFIWLPGDGALGENRIFSLLPSQTQERAYSQARSAPSQVHAETGIKFGRIINC